MSPVLTKIQRQWKIANMRCFWHWVRDTIASERNWTDEEPCVCLSQSFVSFPHFQAEQPIEWIGNSADSRRHWNKKKADEGWRVATVRDRPHKRSLTVGPTWTQRPWWVMAVASAMQPPPGTHRHHLSSSSTKKTENRTWTHRTHKTDVVIACRGYNCCLLRHNCRDYSCRLLRQQLLPADAMVVDSWHTNCSPLRCNLQFALFL